MEPAKAKSTPLSSLRRRSRRRRRLKKLTAWIFPPRASTQTWMILTFARFVGMAVLTVGLYVVFVLRGEIQEAVRQTLTQRAERIAAQIEEIDDRAEHQRLLQEISRLTDFHVTAGTRTEIYADVIAGRSLDERVPLPATEAEVAQHGRPRFDVRAGPLGRNMLYVTLYQPRSDLLLRVGQPEPPLYVLIQRMQVALVVGMVMALLLALLGSWVAANQVTRPLQAIRNSARNISEGQFDEKIQVDSRAAEFQDLAKSLNRMSGRFREKIDELQRLARLQNEFIGNVSHEVRNPIFAVGGYLEALSTPNLKQDQQRRYAEKGLLNLQRLNNLFNDLIEIARLEYREDLIQASTFDLQELIDEVTEMLRPQAEEKGLNLETQNPSVEVRADRNRMRQVLTNLIENAIAYTDEGTVRCRFRRRLDKVRLEVIDTGRGIGEEHRERIFERFYRIDPDRSRKSGGTGLGLSIVKQILHAHGEPIHVESTLGRGTRFWFELPYAEQAVETEAP